MKQMKTRAVKNKEIAMKLVNQGFEILNVTKSRDDHSKSVYIFEDNEGFREAFDKILEDLPKKDNDLGLDNFEKKFLVEILEAKRRELKSYGIKSTATIDGIIVKLSVDYFDNSKKVDDGLADGEVVLRAKYNHQDVMSSELARRIKELNLNTLPLKINSPLANLDQFKFKR